MYYSIATNVVVEHTAQRRTVYRKQFHVYDSYAPGEGLIGRFHIDACGCSGKFSGVAITEVDGLIDTIIIGKFDSTICSMLKKHPWITAELICEIADIFNTDQNTVKPTIAASSPKITPCGFERSREDDWVVKLNRSCARRDLMFVSPNAEITIDTSGGVCINTCRMTEMSNPITMKSLPVRCGKTDCKFFKECMLSDSK